MVFEGGTTRLASIRLRCEDGFPGDPDRNLITGSNRSQHRPWRINFKVTDDQFGYTGDLKGAVVPADGDGEGYSPGDPADGKLSDCLCFSTIATLQ